VEGRGVHFTASSKSRSCGQGRAEDMVNELLGIKYNIAKANATDRKVQNLASYINVESLKAIHKTMDKNKAGGIDRVTKEEYEQNLEKNLENLIERMKSGSYKPNPTRWVYIPKETKGKMRPLGISCYEDMVLVYKCRQKKLNNLYYKTKEQRRCSTWRKTKNPTLRNSNSRSWVCIMPEELRIHNWNVNMA